MGVRLRAMEVEIHGYAFREKKSLHIIFFYLYSKTLYNKMSEATMVQDSDSKESTSTASFLFLQWFLLLAIGFWLARYTQALESCMSLFLERNVVINHCFSGLIVF